MSHDTPAKRLGPAMRKKWCHKCAAVEEQYWMPKSRKYCHEACMTLNDGTCPQASCLGVKIANFETLNKAKDKSNRRRVFPQYNRTQSRQRLVTSRSSAIQKHPRSRYTSL